MQAATSPIIPAGIGLRAPHMAEFVAAPPPVGFIEVHSENFIGRGGRARHMLLQARRDHALSLHGVSLSIGSADPLSQPHLQRLAELVALAEPMLVSDHLCWSSIGGTYAHDLLPLPYTEEALDHVAARVMQVQERLGRTILLENPSGYVEFEHSTIDEATFLAEVARRSGCGILLDVNNLHVSACNHGFDALRWLDALPRKAVREIHLAGHLRRTFEDGELLIDTHDRPVADEVWVLYREALRRFGAVPALVEWDTDLPLMAELAAQAHRADAVRDEWAAETADEQAA